MSRRVKIFSGKSTKNLAERICKEFDGDPLNELKLQRFSDGEFITEIKDTVRGCDVFVIQSLTPPADNIWEMLMIGDALKRASAEQIIGVIPYLNYSRQDRKCNPREPITSKLMADVLQVAGFTRIVTIDLHNDSIQGFYNIPLDHLSANYIFVPYIEKLKLPNLIIGTPDVGGSKRAKKFADKFGCDLVICHKNRPNPGEVGEMKIIGDVKGKDVVLVDDIIDTAGTMCKASDLMMEKGANSIRAIVTHPILSGKAYDCLEKSKINELIVTDTIPLKQQLDKITVLSVDKMLTDAMHRINNHESISNHFNKY
jgi:ribose-phosphate pyrophosphokinase